MIRKRASRGDMLPRNAPISARCTSEKDGIYHLEQAMDRKSNLKQLFITVKVPVVSEPTEYYLR